MIPIRPIVCIISKSCWKKVRLRKIHTVPPATAGVSSVSEVGAEGRRVRRTPRVRLRKIHTVPPATAGVSSVSEVGAEGRRVRRTPRGTRDYTPLEVAVRNQIIGTAEHVFKKHGAEMVETPIMELQETTSLKYGEEAGKLIYNLVDAEDGEQMNLRYDLTLPFARYMASNGISQMKRYSVGKVYRRDFPRISVGHCREFYQCDFDIASASDPMIADAECLKVICEILDKLNLGDFEIKVNDRRLLEAIFSICSVPEEKFRSVCFAIDRLDKATWTDVRSEMVENRGVDPATADSLEEYVRYRETHSTSSGSLVDRFANEASISNNPTAMGTLSNLKLLERYCDCLGVGNRVVFDPSLARGLDYYTGTIFEAVSKGHSMSDVDAEMSGDDSDILDAVESHDRSNIAMSRRMGSVAGGGRYDGLIGSLCGIDQDKCGSVPCVGLSIGVERILMMLLRKIQTGGEGDMVSPQISSTEVYIIVSQSKRTPFEMQQALVEEKIKLCRELWDHGIKAETSYHYSPRLGRQFEYCEKRGIPIEIMIGEEEMTGGFVKLRNTVTRHQENVSRTELVSKLRERLKG